MAVIFGSDKTALRSLTTSEAVQAGAIQVTGNLVYPVIFTSYRLQKSEKLQAIEAFSENSHFNAFGKNADMLILAGNIMIGEEGESLLNSLLIARYERTLRAFRAAESGQLIIVSGPGDIIFTGVANGMEFSAQSEISSVFPFSLSLMGITQGFAVGGSGKGGSISVEV
jgi:hypothetical protein